MLLAFGKHIIAYRRYSLSLPPSGRMPLFPAACTPFFFLKTLNDCEK